MNSQKRAERSPGRWRAAEVAVVLVFGISRFAYRAIFDIAFDASPPGEFVQYLNPWFVEHDFARSILYLHHQAPLQILVVQGCMKLLGLARATVLLEALYHALGLALALASLRVLRRLGAPILPSVVAVSLCSAAPSFVLYENWLFYPLPTASLLVFSLLALLRYYRLGTFRAALVFFSLLGALALLRSTFGSLFICAAAAILLFRPPPAPAGSSRRTILRAVALPLLIVTLNTAKTSWLVGHPYGGALLWQNLCTKVFVSLPAYEQSRLVDRGLVSHAANYRGIVVDPATYGRFRIPHAPTGVPLLDLDEVPGGGRNSHALEHVLVAERYYRPDALYLLRHYPGIYLESVWGAISTQYVSSSIFADGLENMPNFQKLEPLESVSDFAFGRLGEKQLLALIVGLPLAWLYGVYRIVGLRAAAESERASTVAVSYMLLAIGYSAAITLLVSFGDFGRYRFDVDPLYFVLIVLFVVDAWRTARRTFERLLARRRRTARL